MNIHQALDNIFKAMSQVTTNEQGWVVLLRSKEAVIKYVQENEKKGLQKVEPKASNGAN